jgi:hypothetical protein
MLRHYGWLKPFCAIDHDSFWKHGGRIYVHVNDIIDDQVLLPGDIVTFHLYADSRGLGAEACRVEQRATDFEKEPQSELDGFKKNLGLRADAAEFVPVSECNFGSARTVHPIPSEYHYGSSQTEHPIANMFYRLSRTIESIHTNQYIAAINSAYFDDDSSDDDVDAGDADRESCGEDSDHSSIDEFVVSANFSVNKSEEDISPKSKMKLLRSAAPWRKQKLAREPCIEIANDSTSAGGTSASESESNNFARKRGFALATFSPPPGLSLPTQCDMPPGLFFPPGLC